ncbi:MAG: family 78 glycoside hydrolase catalytic domain [Ginsengibacter sp.]
MKSNSAIMNRYFIFFLFFISATPVSAQVSVSETFCDYQQNPIGIDSKEPTLSWQLNSLQRGVTQTACRILVADDSLLLERNNGNVWDTKKISSSQSIHVLFSGKELGSAKTYFWKVKVWDNYGNTSAWSKTSSWQMGMLTKADWKGATWIALNNIADSLLIVPAINNPGDPRWNTGEDTLPLLRKDFVITKKIRKATAFITGLGQFECSINGSKVGDHFLDPGWTKFDKNTLYVTFDITGQLHNGNNTIGVMLGNGFYYVPGSRYRKLKGAYGCPKMICNILITYQDGTTENIVSDESWKASAGPVTFSSIYGGEDYNATLEQVGWNKPGFNDGKWRKVITMDGPQNLQAQSAYPLKILDSFTIKKITQPKPGIWVYDMGQNASAIPELTVEGKRGDEVTIRPAELLDDSGLVMQAPVGTPVYFNYTLKGSGAETWHPQFMYYGFRYIQVEGASPANDTSGSDRPSIISLRSLHTRNSASATGTFTCSDELFNRIFKLIDWAIRSNTASIFTDCPHREKLGWLEEAYLVGSSIRYNYDIATLCKKVISDMKNSQTPGGLIPDIAPEYTVFDGGFRDSPEWGSNGVIMPYYLYQWYGDKQVLEDSYHMMTRYVEYLTGKAKNHILYYGLGDWYDIGPKDLGPSQLTPPGITSTATYYYDLTILSKVARLLNNEKDAERYTALSVGVKDAYNKTFFHDDTKQYGSGSQTSNAISVYMGLVNPSDKKQVVDNIVKDIRQHNNGVTAGDIGFRYLLRVLDDGGKSDVIYDMNSRSDVPGYGYQLARGATALTESWQANRISSNNHFMLGHLMEWLYSGLGGISQEDTSVAFKQIKIRPQPVGDITWAKATFHSPYGWITTNWHKYKDHFVLQVQIPANSGATIYLPATASSKVFENNLLLKETRITCENGTAVIEVASGDYTFEVK